MTVNIADVDAFTSPIVAPTDGDPATGAAIQVGLQGLSNRTRNAKNRLDVLADIDWGVADVNALQVPSGNKVPLTSLAVSGMSIAGDEITVPDAGLYLVTFYGQCSLLSLNPVDATLAFKIKVGGADLIDVQHHFTQTVTVNSTPVFLSATALALITPGQKISIVSGIPELTISLGRLAVVRVKP